MTVFVLQIWEDHCTAIVAAAFSSPPSTEDISMAMESRCGKLKWVEGTRETDGNLRIFDPSHLGPGGPTAVLCEVAVYDV